MRQPGNAWFSLVFLAALVSGPVAALELSLPQTARSTVSTVSDPDTYRLPVGPWSTDTGVPAADLTGQVTRNAWSMQASGVTTQQVLGPLRQQLEDAGYKIIFSCKSFDCGGFDFRFGTEVLRAPDMYVDLADFRFLSAQAPDAGSAMSLLVSRNAGMLFIQMIEVGPTGTSSVQVRKTDPVPVAPVAGELIGELEARGHVVLPGVEFASGSASLGEGAIDSLDTVAAYLLANPNRKVTFVGHTDAVGSLDGNIALSRKRAEAVRAYVRKAGVPAAQVFSNGVGFLSPVASNLTAEGREANRRVEAVLISTE